MMVIDSSTYIGHWPFRKLAFETLPELAAHAQKKGITHIVCTNVNGVFYIDPMEGNRELIEALAQYDGEVTVLPFAVINPAYIEWERDMERCAQMGFRGVELAPLYHGYGLSSMPAARAYRKAGELGLAVKVQAEFENFRQRHRMDVSENVAGGELAALLAASGKTATIISATHPASLGEALIHAANARDNVFFDLILPDAYTQSGMQAALAAFGAQRLCFGTLSPFRYVEPQYVKLFGAKVTGEEENKAILSGNLARVFGLA